jgi:ribonuclease D
MAPIMADPSIEKVIHGADYDVAMLRRDFGFAINGLFDTMLACRFLGWTEFGLGAALNREFGLTVDKGPQKADWSRRPLPPALHAYAAQDVSHLIPLRNRLVDALSGMGREAWAREESEAVSRMASANSAPPPGDPWKAPGARDLSPREASILVSLFQAREDVARRINLPRFRVVHDGALVTLASARPASVRDLAHVPGVPRTLLRRPEYWLGAIARGEAAPETLQPATPRTPRPRTSPVVGARLGLLREWRTDAAERFGLDPGFMLPQRLIVILAVEAPTDREGLLALDGLRKWRVEAFGDELLAVLHPPARPGG